jgi:hypothetical protein
MRPGMKRISEKSIFLILFILLVSALSAFLLIWTWLLRDRSNLKESLQYPQNWVCQPL